jgi:hypothetical protein
MFYLSNDSSFSFFSSFFQLNSLFRNAHWLIKWYCIMSFILLTCILYKVGAPKILDGDMLTQFLELTNMQQNNILSSEPPEVVKPSLKPLLPQFSVNQVVQLLERVHYALNWPHLRFIFSPTSVCGKQNIYTICSEVLISYCLLWMVACLTVCCQWTDLWLRSWSDQYNVTYWTAAGKSA